jgi:hypothetical protein
MMLTVYQMFLSDKLKDKSNTGHSTTQSRLSSLTEVPLKHMNWYSYICLASRDKKIYKNGFPQVHKYEYTNVAF